MKNQSRVGWAETSGFRLKGRMFFTEREIDRSAAGLFAVSAPRGKPQETKQSIVAYERIVHKESASAQIPDDLPREERIIDRSSCFFPAATPGFGDAAQLSSPTQKNSCRPTSHGSRACRLRRGGVGTAGGDVAHAALFDIRCPGAPVEIGFSSNAAEERNLGSAAYILI